MNIRDKKCNKFIFVLGVFGLVCVLTGGGIAVFGRIRLLDMWYRENFSLLGNSLAFLFWGSLPQPVFFNVYIFNVTNPEEIVKGAKPKLIETGPYVYREVVSKEILRNTDKRILSFKFKTEMSFISDSKKNFSNDNDSVIVLNVPLLQAYSIAEEAIPSLLTMVDSFREKAYSKESNIFVRTSVKNFLFNGLRINCTSKEFQVVLVCKTLWLYGLRGFRMHKKTLKFSFFHYKNGTFNKTFEVQKGYSDPRTSAQFLTIDNSTTLKIWQSEYCNMLNGSDGLRFPVHLNKTKKLYVFEKELCRSLHLEFEENVIRNGTNLYRYVNTENLFASKDNNPDNACFCRKKVGEIQIQKEHEALKNPKSLLCLKNGALSMQPCGAGLLVASFPHFYLGDQSYIDYSGLAPVKNIHESYAIIEPITGTLIEGYKRFQLNMEIKKIRGVKITENLKAGLFPILWFEEGLNLSDDFFQMVQYKLFERIVIEYGVFYLMAVGVTIMVFSLIFHTMIRKILCF